MRPTLPDFALGTRLAASSGVAKRAFSFWLQWSATVVRIVPAKEPTEDAKENQPRLYGFRAVYVFDRLSRDLRPSLCAPDRSRGYHF
jgi:hypothetical protein